MKCTFFLVKREVRKQEGSDQENADRNSSQVSFFAYHPIYTEQGEKPSTTANPEHFWKVNYHGKSWYVLEKMPLISKQPYSRIKLCADRCYAFI